MEKGQSKFRSLLEANVNTLVGLGLTFIFSPLFYWLVGMTYTFKQLGVVTLLFTLLSVIRGYIIRRIFNKKEERKDSKLLIEKEQLKKSLDLQRGLNTHWSTLYKKLRTKYVNALDELDMCKHLHTAAVSDLVEGANYYSSEDGYTRHDIESAGLKISEEPPKPLPLEDANHSESSM